MWLPLTGKTTIFFRSSIDFSSCFQTEAAFFSPFLMTTCSAHCCLLPSQKGFEPRGTAIGQRLVTWNNMLKNTGYKATLANYPFKYADEQAKKYFTLTYYPNECTFSFLRHHCSEQLIGGYLTNGLTPLKISNFHIYIFKSHDCSNVYPQQAVLWSNICVTEELRGSGGGNLDDRVGSRGVERCCRWAR